jgi:hypothetical protein
MKQYALLGTYSHGTRRNIKILATSGDYHELRKIRTLITIINRELEGKDGDLSNPKVTRLIDKQLSSIDSLDEDTGFVYEIRVIGIFILDTFVRVHCPYLQKASLYRNQNHAELFVLYCPYCSK